MTILPYDVSVRYSEAVPGEPMRVEFAVTLEVPNSIAVQYGLGPTPKRLEKYFQKIAEASFIFMERNVCYGDAIKLGGLKGAVYELIGIFGRLWNIVIKKSDEDIDGLRLANLFTDGINYLCIAQMMLDEGNIDGRFLEE